MTIIKRFRAIKRSFRGKSVKFYLAGPINAVEDGSYVTWRTMIREFLASIGHAAVNPLDKYQQGPGTEKKLFEDSVGDPSYAPALIREHVRRRVINPDYDLMDQSDACIVYIPFYSVGTSAELGYLYRQKKPVYAVVTIPRKKWSAWMIGLTTLIFPSWNDLKSFLEKMKEV